MGYVPFHYAILGMILGGIPLRKLDPAYIATTCNGTRIVLQQGLRESALTAFGLLYNEQFFQCILKVYERIEELYKIEMACEF